MAEIKFPIVELDEERFQVSIDTSLYAKEVITAAVYKFSHLFYIHQQTDVRNNIIINVIFESKDNSKITEDTGQGENPVFRITKKYVPLNR